ncbi:hypothetical protein LTR15_004455 [Elasticomyces elasticus]|nr:hypothetical protein LTR15_004455 [Elasticomyces elasticus]
MVGVPGRSKGCHTCKKRRVRCDEEKPVCARCTKGGFTCGGYAKALEIRMSTLSVVQDPPASSKVQQTGRKYPARSSDDSTVGQVTQSTALDPPLFPAMSLVAFKEPIHYAYLFDNFVWSSYGSPWLQLSAAGKLGSLPYEACEALSQCTFGMHYAQQDMELHGTIMYGRTVAVLRSGLARGGKQMMAGLLPIMLILMMHSNLTLTYAEGRNHILGMIALLQTCGPEAFQHQPLRSAFSSCRSTLITISLVTQKRSFLEEERWRVLPWARQREMKSNQDTLVDIMSILPGLLEDWATLQEGAPDSAEADMRPFCLRVQSGLQALFMWRHTWDAAHPQAAWERPRSTSTTPSRNTYPPDARNMLFYETFSLAVEHTLYNALLICMLSLLHLAAAPEDVREYMQSAFTNSIGTHQPVDPRLQVSPLLFPGETWDLHGPAVEIALAFEYELANIKHRSESALFWLFPLGLAYKVLEHDIEFRIWIQEMLDVSQGLRNYGRRGNVGFDFYNFFPLPRTDRTETRRGGNRATAHRVGWMYSRWRYSRVQLLPQEAV